jgi:hypothetical protein
MIHLGKKIDNSVDFSTQIKEKALGAKLSAKAINNLPDSDFAYIQPGGKKDSEGKTIPRSLRHLPIPDAAHVRNALARLNQTDIPAEAKKKALSKITRKAKELGVHVSKSDGATDKSKQEKLEKEEYGQDKNEMDSETLKERLRHHQDAVKNLEKEINSLKKDKKEDMKDIKKESDAASDKQKAAREKFLEMIRKKQGGDKKGSDKKGSDKKDSDKKSDDKKPGKKDESKGGMKDGKPSYPDLDKPNSAKTKKEWDKTDTKELKRDTKKEKKEHEKDAIKDDQSKINKLKKGAPSEKKSVEVHDLKKDEKFDKARATDFVKISRLKDGAVEVDINYLKDSDFLFPATRSFPILTASDVEGAISNFGRTSGSMSYDEFKIKLVSFVKNKGPEFVEALPEDIKKEFDLTDATQIAVFPDKYVDPKDVGTFFQDTRPINREGYEIDDKIQEQVKKDKLKNPQLRSAQQRAEGLR